MKKIDPRKVRNQAQKKGQKATAVTGDIVAATPTEKPDEQAPKKKDE